MNLPLKSNSKLEEFVLVTLSFFEQMTFSQVILDFDKDLLLDFPDLSNEGLQEVLLALEKKKLIKRVVIDKEIGWVRVHPKRSWWKKIFSL